MLWCVAASCVAGTAKCAVLVSEGKDAQGQRCVAVFGVVPLPAGDHATGVLAAFGRMAETWRAEPPYPNWRSYAGALAQYARGRLQRNRLPEGTPLADWYRHHDPQLRRDPARHDKNRVVAGALLPMSEREPEHRAAVEYLNVRASGLQRSFREYLTDWHRSVPARHRRFVRRIAGEFGHVLEVE